MERGSQDAKTHACLQPHGAINLLPASTQAPFISNITDSPAPQRVVTRRGRQRLFGHQPAAATQNAPVRVLPRIGQSSLYAETSACHVPTEFSTQFDSVFTPDRHEVSSPQATESRCRRKRKLDQRFLARTGVQSESNHSMSCGHFDPVFLEALKGTPCVNH
ncbi:hypothetical protein SORBI_3003G335501 [Sorghum bicolor]|uniref:Uncharacterized protein n=1 Tax=Sorghum bicolor TaxID=4558 RepID=A0A1W0W043_SORBI|nr:hypothetical protein SORBI_3003G335501 [Sorghum bicolor]